MANRKDISDAKKREYFSDWANRYFFINLYLDTFKDKFPKDEYEKWNKKMNYIRDIMIDFAVLKRR